MLAEHDTKDPLKTHISLSKFNWFASAVDGEVVEMLLDKLLPNMRLTAR